MSSFALGFRDYVIHMFPGAIAIAPATFAYYDFSTVEGSYKALPALLSIFLVGGYLAGIILEAASMNHLTKATWKYLGGNPYDIINRGRTTRDTTQIVQEALSRFFGLFGKDMLGSSNTTIIYTMARYCEAANERSSLTISRINALENMARNLSAAFFAVAVYAPIVLWGTPVVAFHIAVFTALLGLLMMKRRRRYRVWYLQTVLRSFIVLTAMDSASNRSSAG